MTEWTEDGRPHIRRELWLRCAHCDYGHNGHNNATVRDLTRMGELAEGHTGACRRGGRTFRLDSSDAVRAAALSDQAEQVVRLASPLEAAHDA
ncbi:hypothetical protein JNJ66_06425 [Candidatus Saccharibacteria bacterium]|nr:hypothetical protein [Candidatus Saccharibacteria bacterium]